MLALLSEFVSTHASTIGLVVSYFALALIARWSAAPVWLRAIANRYSVSISNRLPADWKKELATDLKELIRLEIKEALSTRLTDTQAIQKLVDPETTATDLEAPTRAPLRSVPPVVAGLAIALVATSVGCAGTPCDKLDNTIKVTHSLTEGIGFVCQFLAGTASGTAYTACVLSAGGFNVTAEVLQSFHDEFCVTDAASDTGDAGTCIRRNLTTQDQFAQEFARHGATRKVGAE